jgi:hypothetical protein
MLSEYFCDRLARRLSSAQRIPTLKQWLTEQINLLNQFTPDGCIHCTDCVVDEYKPGPILDRLPNKVKYNETVGLRQHVGALLDKGASSIEEVRALTNLPHIPKRRPGDNDLTLVVLGLQLSVYGEPVYVITNDQDLLSFITWIRTKKEAGPNPGLLQGFMGVTYLDLIHRDCRIQTERMRDILKFAMTSHYNRKELAGSRKGESIMQQLLQANDSLIKSVEIKTAARGGVL